MRVLRQTRGASFGNVGEIVDLSRQSEINFQRQRDPLIKQRVEICVNPSWPKARPSLRKYPERHTKEAPPKGTQGKFGPLAKLTVPGHALDSRQRGLSGLKLPTSALEHACP